jgi:8-oxo-dGTP diphosphatase
VVYPVMTTPSGRRVLLGSKNTGLGVGRIVGPGGKVEPGESARQAAIRELYEEVGLRADEAALEPIAQMTYPFVARPHLSQRSRAFLLPSFTGTPTASAELTPSWWDVDSIPFERMWADAKLWLPQALEGHFQQATITIGELDDVADIRWEDGKAYGTF